MTFRKSSFKQDPMEATGSFAGTFDGNVAGTGSFTGSAEITGTFTGSFTGAVAILSSGSGKEWAKSTGSDAGGSFNANDFTLGELGPRFAALVDELVFIPNPPPPPAKPSIASPQIEYDARIVQENPIVTLEDQSGQGNDATGFNNPEYEVDGWSSGIGAFRLMSSGPEFLTFDGTPFVGTEFTWFIVFEATDLSPETVLLGGTTGTTNQNLHIVIFSNGAIRFAFWANDIQTASGLVAEGGRHILTGRHSNSTGRILRLDGVEVAADGGKTTDLTAWGGSAVGRKQSVYGIDKRIAWIGGYSSAASDGEILEMEAFLTSVFF